MHMMASMMNGAKTTSKAEKEREALAEGLGGGAFIKVDNNKRMVTHLFLDLLAAKDKKKKVSNGTIINLVGLTNLSCSLCKPLSSAAASLPKSFLYASTCALSYDSDSSNNLP